MPTQRILGLVTVALCLVGDRPTLAARQDAAAPTTRYEFTTILNSQRDRVQPTRCAAINTFGVVAVQVRDATLGISQLITKRAAQ